MKLTKVELLSLITDIDQSIVGIKQCALGIVNDIVKVTKEYDRLRQAELLSEKRIREADELRRQMALAIDAIAKAEAEAEAKVAAEKAKVVEYDVLLGDTFDCYTLAVLGIAESGKYMLCALDISDKHIRRWQDPIEVEASNYKNVLHFSSKELRELNVVPARSVHKSA